MSAATILPPDGVRVTVGGLSREQLVGELARRGILLNEYAETLLVDRAFDGSTSAREVTVVERTVADLGLAEGGSLSLIFSSAEAHGLRLCPATTGPYLRLALTDQVSAPDSVLTSGRAPSGSLTVAAPAFRDDDEFPKGFYLRVIDGRAWLRGYRSDDAHTWSPGDRFAFEAPAR